MDGNRFFVIEWDATFWGMVQSGVEMQRDDDFLRQMLLDMEASAEWVHGEPLLISSPPEAQQRHYHMLLLADAGMVAPVGGRGDFYRITNAGHDFLALTRRSETWEATKAAGSKLGGASVQMLYRIAEGFARQKLTELGIPIA